MENELCFVCGSRLHPKYILPITDNDIKVLGLEEVAEDSHLQSETKAEFCDKDADVKLSCSKYQNDKFRKIQDTLFKLILRVTPSTRSDDGDNLSEIPAEICDKCEDDIYHVCQTNLEIQKLQNELVKVSNSILDSVISSAIEHCFSEDNNIKDYKKYFSELERNDMKILNKLLPKDSVTKRVCKKWRSKFYKAFREKMELETAISTIEPDIDHYEEEINTCPPNSCEEDLSKYFSEESEYNNSDSHSEEEEVDEKVFYQGQNTGTDHINDVKVLRCSSDEADPTENMQEIKSSTSNKRAKMELKSQTKVLRGRRFSPKDVDTEMTDPLSNVIKNPMTKEYQCSECGQLCKREARLKEHMEIYHNQKIRDTGKYRCPECTTCFIRYQHLEHHLSNAHNDVNYGFEWCKLCKMMIIKTGDHVCKTFYKKCPVCEKDFNSINVYRLHRKEVCTAKRRGEKGSKHFRCDICPKSFNRKQGLLYHKKTHTGEKNFTCGACDKMFTSKNQLQVHERIHSGEKPYVCDLCGLTFSSSPSLVSHKKTHLGVKPYKCDTCGKSFRSLGHLTTHQIIHTGEKPFSCPICQKSFNRKENLRSHEYTHATNKPHKCCICPSTSFVRASLLRNHMKSRHSKKTSHPVKSSSSSIEIKSKTQHNLLTRVTDCKEMKTQLRIIKGNNSVIPISNLNAKPSEPEPTKNIAYLVAGNPGRYIVLKNVVAADQIRHANPDSILSE